MLLCDATKAGWFLVDKPAGISSFQALSPIKKALGVRRVGHAGTLDPFATGLLLVCVGRATRLLPFTQKWSKRYCFEVCWGAETTTDDLTGTVVKKSDQPLPEEAVIKASLSTFQGDILQEPPQFSALKVQGRRAYERVRSGERVVMKPRPQKVYALHMLHHEKGRTTFEAEVDGGTYIRSLARDLGRHLGCFGYVTALKRTHIGRFSEKDVLSLDFLKKNSQDKKALGGCLRPCHELLDDIPALETTLEVAERLSKGQRVAFVGTGVSRFVFFVVGTKTVAFGSVEAGFFYPQIVFI